MFGKKTEKQEISGSLLPHFSLLNAAASEAKCTSLAELFERNPNRADDYCFSLGAPGSESLRFDFSKTHLNKSVISLFEQFAQDSSLLQQRDKLLAGEVVNPTEKRPALHAAMRSDTASDEILTQREASYQFAEAVRNGKITNATGTKYRHIIHLGIGGSALGPQLLLQALGFGIDSDFETHCVANVDGHALQPAMDACDPNQTLVIVASKTFTTTETLCNAKTLMSWMEKGGVSNPLEHLVGVTASPEKAEKFGISKEKVLTFPEGLGGRYSIWSSVSLVAMIVLGRSAFEAMRAGAIQMDQHFATAPVSENIPLLAAMTDVWYGNAWGAATRAQFAYDSRLCVLLPYLQQLEMENNGKNISAEGEKIEWQSSPILWGGIGTDAQHAVFQLLHQGTHLIPTEFIAVIKAGHDLDEHHKCLLANCFAQSAALMKGRTADQARAMLPDSIESDSERELLAQSKSFSGNRPSTTIILESLDAKSLGALIAFYEHRSFVSGTLWQINVFDQMGVELGKELAKSYQEVIESGDFGSLDIDDSTRKLLQLVLN
jgi:glucose-6-phosphate isomerase